MFKSIYTNIKANKSNIFMKFYSTTKSSDLSIMYIIQIAYACLRDMKDYELVKVYPEDLDFIKFSNFKILNDNLFKQSHFLKNEKWVRYFCCGNINIGIIVSKQAHEDQFLIERDINSIVKIAKDYIRINLYGIECSRAYKRVFLGCALHYGIANYKLKNFAMMHDNKCIDAAKEISFFSKRDNEFSVFMNINYVYYIIINPGFI